LCDNNSHFHEKQKNATIKACEDAGFKFLGTLNDSEAAFGLEVKKKESEKW
jgi:molecular chaperone DnaK (HSP70)